MGGKTTYFDELSQIAQLKCISQLYAQYKTKMGGFMNEYKCMFQGERRTRVI